MRCRSIPLLIVVAGRARGRSVPIAESVSIGRGDDNVLAIPDPALSRHHCVVEMGAAGSIVRDLDSKNGVFVNGCPVTERALADSDQIRIGDSALLVVLAERGGVRIEPTAVTLVDTPVPSTSTIAIDAASSRYVATRGGDAERGHAPPRDLGVLLASERSAAGRDDSRRAPRPAADPRADGLSRRAARPSSRAARTIRR